MTEMVEGCLTGAIRAMYVVGENPLLSEPDLNHAREGVRAARLPGRPGPLPPRDRRAGPRVPAGRRVRREGGDVHQLRAARPARAPGRWRRPATRGRTGGSPPSWPSASPGGSGAGGGRQLRLRGRRPRSSTRWRALVPFLGGLSHARLDREGGIQWPCPAPDHPGTRYLYAESFPAGQGQVRPGHAGRGGRRAARTRSTRSSSTPAGSSTTGTAGPSPAGSRGCSSWPRASRSRSTPPTRGGCGCARATRCGSSRGAARWTGSPSVTDAVREGAIFVPFVKLAESAANFLTNSAHDPESKIPSTRSAPSASSAWRPAARPACRSASCGDWPFSSRQLFFSSRGRRPRGV